MIWMAAAAAGVHTEGSGTMNPDTMAQATTLVERIQQELLERADLAPCQARALLSNNRERLIIQYRHPVTGQASSFDAGFIADIQDDETRLVEILLKRLKNRLIEKPSETETRTGT